jgi:hypothetical protein
MSSRWGTLDNSQRRQVYQECRSDKKQLPLYAERLEMPIQTLMRRLREFKQCDLLIKQGVGIPESPTEVYDDCLNLNWEDCIIISDIEIPDHSAKMLEWVIWLGKELGITHCMIAGDYLSQDHFALQPKTKGVPILFPDVVQKYGIPVFEKLLLQFTELTFFEGNHDERIAKWNCGQVNFNMLVRGLGIKYSEFNYCYLHNTYGVTTVCHPTNYRQAPQSLGRALYEVEPGPPGMPTKTHIVLAHTHMPSSGWSRDGLYEVHSLGCLRDPERTWYKAKTKTTFPQWKNSFMVILGGKFFPVVLGGSVYHEWIPEFIK